MASSRGAAITAASGRGDSSFSDRSDYRVVLPQLPSGEAMKRAVVLHCDIAGRPYRIEDFRQPLKDIGVIREVGTIGADQMSHVWLLNLRTDEAKKKLLEAGQLVIKGKPCLVVDPARHELRLKLHWVSFDVTGDTIRRAFAEYGDVKEVTSEKWRVPDFENAESTTRLVRMVLRDGVTLDRIPHQLRLGGGTVLVVVPGRPPICLRCRTSGHIRRDCRVPRCTECRAFGHERTECSRSYARAAARGTEGAADTTELLMDEEEAEQAAASAATQAKPEVTKEAAVMATTEGGGPGEPPKPAGKEEDGQQTSVTETVGKVVNVVPAHAEDTDTPGMDVDEAALKRRHDEAVEAWQERKLSQLEKQWKTGSGRGVRVPAKVRASSLTRGDKQAL
uniref:CCHC-type domain-containing protein n=1 Tax=Ixodes ricinus TaxID=34613 RepID=A0A6B0V9T9_IXORI